MFVAVSVVLILQSCTSNKYQRVATHDLPPAPTGTQMLAVYEPWFGTPHHINVGYSSHDPAVITRQIAQAKNLGISGFVIDWYGYREAFHDHSYALVQTLAAQNNFHVAMMYDEASEAHGDATQSTLVDFNKFHDSYLMPDSPGREAYLTYKGRPVIFIFSHGGNTDWSRVREETNSWNPRPLLIYEGRRMLDPSTFDGYYAWISPGPKGWSADGSHWGEGYLIHFYREMQSKYPDKIVVGAVWPGFDDSKASWGKGRFMSQRCGKTFADTMHIAQQYYPSDNPLPFLLVETWNDYEEGTAIERGLKPCPANNQARSGE